MFGRNADTQGRNYQSANRTIWGNHLSVGLKGCGRVQKCSGGILDDTCSGTGRVFREGCVTVFFF